MEKRLRILGITIVILMTILTGRLAYIQLAGHEELSAAAYKQQQISLEGADSRGTIYDRYGNPIAGQQQEYIYIIEKDNFDGETMNALNHLEADEVKGQEGDYKVFVSEKYIKSEGERLINNSDAYIMEAGRRYTEDQSAVHLIGYVNPADNTGASGLELQYDEELSMLNKRVSATADVNGSLLHGKGVSVMTAAENDEYIKEGITTTLDLTLQKKVEKILKESDYDGAVVVLKSDTGELLASASTPVFDPMDVEKYIQSRNGELINKVTQGEYPPGSVFKIAVAAAALEEGMMPSQEFSCAGSEIISGQQVMCSTGGENGHGTITFEEAFAESCNCAFIQIAQQIGAEDILTMAEKLGLGKPVLNGYPEEKSGNLMTAEMATGSALANLALGQGETLVTPIQIAKLTATVANGGVCPGVYLADDKTEIHEPLRIFSEYTSEQLKEMMEGTMKYGTGKNLNSQVSMAAKTGSAQSVQSGVEVVHGWITGFIPAESPEYIITVFMEDGKSGSGSAGPVFAEIAQYIDDSKMIQYEMGL